MGKPVSVKPVRRSAVYVGHVWACGMHYPAVTMSERQEHGSQEYQRIRSEFDLLGTQDKVAFLVEATVSMAAHGLKDFGQALADELDRVFGDCSEASSCCNDDGTKAAQDDASEAGEPAPAAEGGNEKAHE